MITKGSGCLLLFQETPDLFQPHKNIGSFGCVYCSRIFLFMWEIIVTLNRQQRVQKSHVATEEILTVITMK